MSTSKTTPRPPSGDRMKTLRDWIDVIAKASIALVGVFLAYLADNYQQKASVVTLLSQRETAESNLRSSMMGHLIGPFVGSAEQNKPLAAERAQVLLELLALNFHSHLELKPLFMRVDRQLHDEGRDAGRPALEGIARRVVDRQIAMLRAAAPDSGRSGWRGLFSPPPAAARPVDLFFRQTGALQDSERMLVARDDDGRPSSNDPNTLRYNAADNPVLFGSGGGQSVCSISPDGRYALRMRVTSFSLDERTAAVSWQMSRNPQDCAAAKSVAGGSADKGDAWQPAKGFTITSYDFPLTDNTQLDPTRRFALNLYYIVAGDPVAAQLQLKLVWFPEGYITERERPMNYFEVNRTLGIE
jgi:hypothetical protein